MDILGLIFVLGTLVPVWLTLRQIDRLPARVCSGEFGVVVKSVRAFDEVSEVIGHYMGCDIYRAVTFKGLRYVFDGVAEPPVKQTLRARQLFLEPGLMYVMA